MTEKIKKITFIRHAQSRFNSGKITHDEIVNCRITEEGKQQANKLNNSFDLIILSPLKRAMETYVHSNIKTKRVVISELFREFKSWNLNMLENEDPKDVETHEQMIERAKSSIEYIKSLPEQNIGIISHHDFLQVFSEYILGQKISVPNCGSITFEIKEVS
jgi:broad specificity phosphatase PhoE